MPPSPGCADRRPDATRCNGPCPTALARIAPAGNVPVPAETPPPESPTCTGAPHVIRTGSPATRATLALFTALCLATPGPVRAQSPDVTAFQPNERLLNAELLQRGRRVYTDHSAGCHGGQGDGQGPAAYGLNPKPRDFTTAIFKLRSTPAGSLPTDEDLIRTVKQGVPGTSMAAFNLMPEPDVVAVVQYLKTFSDTWRDPDRHEPPTHLPPVPAWFRDPVRRRSHAESGRDLFIGNCSTCHGDEGRGDGISATALMDAWDQPSRPANLITGRIKSGRGLADLFKAITTGLDGSPMPSFEEALPEEERWDIVAYLHELRETHRQQKFASNP